MEWQLIGTVALLVVSIWAMVAGCYAIASFFEWVSVRKIWRVK